MKLANNFYLGALAFRSRRNPPRIWLVAVLVICWDDLAKAAHNR
jgi:hypothetical protein